MVRALAVIVVLAAMLAEARAGEIEWQTDLERARTVAREQGKPLFLVFRCET